MKDDILDEIFSMQRGLTDAMDLSRYPDDTQERISNLCTAIMHEAVELQRTTNWKWWKTPVTFDTEHAKEELIDIWHFVGVLIVSKATEPNTTNIQNLLFIA